MLFNKHVFLFYIKTFFHYKEVKNLKNLMLKVLHETMDANQNLIFKSTCIGPQIVDYQL